MTTAYPVRPSILAVTLLVAVALLQVPTGTSAHSAPCIAANLPLNETVQLDQLFDPALDAPATRAFLAGNGQKVIFLSRATNIAAQTADGSQPILDGTRQVFVLDLTNGVTRLVSVNAHGDPADADCTLNEAAIDHLGQVVVFECSADNLVAADTNGLDDIFVHFVEPAYGHEAGVTLRVSRGFTGPPNLADPSGADADGPSEVASIAARTGVVVFSSGATNLIENGFSPRNPLAQVQNYTFNLETGQIRLISRPLGRPDGAANRFVATASIDAEGMRVVTPTFANNLIPRPLRGEDPDAAFLMNLFSINLDLGLVRLLTKTGTGEAQTLPPDWCSLSGEAVFVCGSFSPDVSDNGLLTVFDTSTDNFDPDRIDANQTIDVYLHNAVTNRIQLLSRSPAGPAPTQFPDGIPDLPKLFRVSDSPDISGNGRFVIYRTTALEWTEGQAGYGYVVVDLARPTEPGELISRPPPGAEPFSLKVSVTVDDLAQSDMPNLTSNGEIAAFEASYVSEDAGTAPGDRRRLRAFLRCLR
mgnify:CR=1 FL=1